MNNLNSSLRAYLRGLARRRNSGVVTADDVVQYLTRKNITLSQNERLSTTRLVLSAPEFFPVGQTRSRRPEARGRYITRWATN